MRAAESGIPVGTVINGKYRVEGILGRGGMGTVYRAQHLALNEPIAMKILLRAAAADSEIVTRFLREAQSTVKLRSEHVARVHDIGQTEEKLPFMVMEYLEGADLGQLVEQNGAMHPPIAVDLLLQACDAIAEAHSLGIVHRDIKPTNLYVSFRPDQTAIVKVLDFGISKVASTDLSLTQTQSMLGTPAYMSPEQMRSARDVDQRTDIWSIGTVLYELVEARRPFQAESFSEMCVMVAIDPPQPMVFAPELQAVVVRCLQKDPDQRYANVAELMADLAPFANNPDAAKYFLKRAQRVLGLRDSQPALHPARSSSPSIGSEPKPAAPPIALPIAALTMHRAPRPALSVTVSTQGTTRNLPASRGGRAWIGALAMLVLVAGGAFAYVELVASSEPPHPDTVIVDPAARAPIAAPVVEPAVAIDATIIEEGSATVLGDDAGVETATIEKPPVKKPPTKKPPVKKPPVKKPPEVKPPVVKPKCDPFDSRVKC